MTNYLRFQTSAYLPENATKAEFKAAVMDSTFGLFYLDSSKTAERPELLYRAAGTS